MKVLGFSINTYDRCVANNIIDGKKCTIVWYNYYKNLPHVHPNLVTDILEEIKKHFGGMVISRDDTNNFLGMTIKISNNKKVELMMKHQIEDTLIQFKYVCGFKVTFPCIQNLLDVNIEAQLLDGVKADFFH